MYENPGGHGPPLPPAADAHVGMSTKMAKSKIRNISNHTHQPEKYPRI